MQDVKQDVNIESFLLDFAKLLADKPEAIKTELKDLSDDKYDKEVILYLDKCDIGKLIGKEGKMISSLKTFISGYRAKSDTSYKITIDSQDA